MSQRNQGKSVRYPISRVMQIHLRQSCNFVTLAALVTCCNVVICLLPSGQFWIRRVFRSFPEDDNVVSSCTFLSKFAKIKLTLTLVIAAAAIAILYWWRDDYISIVIKISNVARDDSCRHWWALTGTNCVHCRYVYWRTLSLSLYQLNRVDTGHTNESCK